MVMRTVSSWGRVTAAAHDWRALADRPGVAAALQGARGIAFGNGRSYGDVGLNPGGALWGTRGLDRFIAFDAGTGVLDCESGVLLAEILALALPQGWFLPVTPGTQYVTVGGAIANDVHGKNHHAMGTFGEHVDEIVLLRTDGTRIVCGPGCSEGWFRATVGGMGLTGVIVSARLRLRRVPGPWIDADVERFESLAEFVAQSERATAEREYNVAWIDCLATRGEALRGVLFRGRHGGDATPLPRQGQRRVPFTPPLSLVNRMTLTLFNRAYHWRQGRRAGRAALEPYTSFFYPLDGVLDWNRIYGPRGFFQYQCVVPRASQHDAMREILNLIARDGSGSFLGVIKTFGERPEIGMLSFPMPGITLALDFPNHGAATRALFARLDAVVMAAGGRLYAAKDACMPRELFERGYARLAEFANYRDPGISSQMSRRLLGS